MSRLLTVTALLTLSGQALAAPCVFAGDVRAYVGCIADQASEAVDATSYRYQMNDDAEVMVARQPAYHMTLTVEGGYENRSRPIPLPILDELCGDADGCHVRIGMTGWTSADNTAAASREFQLYYSPSDGRWRASTDVHAISGDGSTDHVINAGSWGTCYLTDTEYEDHVNLGDNDRGLHLLLWDGYTGPTRGCHLTLID